MTPDPDLHIAARRGADALAAADSLDRAARADGADPLDGLADRVRLDPAAILAPRVVAALARLRRDRADECERILDACAAAAVEGGGRIRLTDLRAALTRADRARRAEESPRPRRPPDPPPEETGLPVVEVSDHDLVAQTDVCVAALAGHPDVYRRGGDLVRLRHVDDAAALHCGPEPGSVVVEALPVAAAEEYLSVRVDFRKGPRRVATAPGAAQRVLARGTYPSARPVVAVVTSPVMLATGAIVASPGYDAASGIYSTAPAVDIPEHPSRDDARAAAARLADLFTDFPFAGDADARRVSVAALLGAILTPLARHAVDRAPGFIAAVTRPDGQSAGKSLAMEVCGAIVMGRAPAARPWSSDPAEQRKALASIAFAGPPTALFDNVRGHIEGAAVEALLTADTFADRELGASRTVEVPWRTTLYFSANDATVSRDIAARLRWIMLDVPPDGARVYQRPRLLDHVIAHRVEYLRDALTILRAHTDAGRPPAPALTKYEAWSEVVASAIAWAYDASPALAHPPAGANRDADHARAVVAAWCVSTRGDDTPRSVADIRDRILRGESRWTPLRDALVDLCGAPDLIRVTPRSIGRRLRAVTGRDYAAPWGGTMRVDTRDDRRGVAVYAARCAIAPPLDGGAYDARDDGDDHPAAMSTEETWSA